MTPPILGIVGPTGVGKTEVTAAVARRVQAEIIVIDSMQVYRGMDLGTGKPGPSLREEIPHHGLDLVDPEEEFNVARYLKQVAPIPGEVQKRGRLPLLVGGTGLYLKTLLDGLCPAPGKDPLIRGRLWEESQRAGPEALHARLESVDPVAAGRIHRNDLRRVLRALEVFLVTGRPLTAWHQQTQKPIRVEESLLLFGLTGSREWLYRRIEERIDGWISAGWLEEARSLHRKSLSLTASQALGYRELFAYLDGRIDWETAVELIKRDTRRYAKRQWSWFRHEPRVRWISVEGKNPEDVAGEILAVHGIGCSN